MEPTLFHVITWAAGLLVAGGVRLVHTRIANLEDRQREFELSVPEKYVGKHDLDKRLEHFDTMLGEMRIDIKNLLTMGPR
jgi:hypothetical protein